jgi:hypothetical protein
VPKDYKQYAANIWNMEYGEDSGSGDHSLLNLQRAAQMGLIASKITGVKSSLSRGFFSF